MSSTNVTPDQITVCAHRTKHRAEVDVNCLEDSGNFMADVRIWCADCGQPFRFIGLPMGLDMKGAAMSVDGTEGRFAVHPANDTPHPLSGFTGFGVKQS